MTDFLVALLSGAIGGGLIAGFGAYIALNSRLQKLEYLNKLGEKPFQTITDRKFELLEQAKTLNKEIGEINTEVLGQKDKINGLKTDVNNYDQIIRLLDKLRNENTNLDSFEKIIEISPEIINIQSKFSNFEGQLRQLNSIEIHKVRIGRYGMNIGNQGQNLQKGKGQRSAKEWVGFGCDFNHPPTVFVAISKIQSGYSESDYKG